MNRRSFGIATRLLTQAYNNPFGSMGRARVIFVG
jgi:hypothetical protein